MNENKEKIKAEDDIKINNDVENTEQKETPTEKKPKKRSIFKKFIVLCILILAIAPLTYYDIDTLMAKFSELTNKVQGYVPVENNNNIIEIQEREQAAQQIVIEANEEPIVYDDMTDITEEEIVVIPEEITEEEFAEEEPVVPETPVVASIDLTPLTERLDAIESKMEVIKRERDNQGMAFVLMQLRIQIDTGVPYIHELAIFETMLNGDEKSIAMVKLLQEYAQNGIPTQTSLAKEFINITSPKKIGVIIPENTSWSDNLIIKLRSLISIRNTEESTDKTLMDAIDTARNSVYENNLAGAVEALLPHKDKVAEPMAIWIKNAQMRIEAIKAINALMSNAVVLYSAERLM